MSHPDAPKQTCLWCQQRPGRSFLNGSPCCASCLLRHAQHLVECDDDAPENGCGDCTPEGNHPCRVGCRFGPHRVIGEFSGDPSCAVCHHAWPCPTVKQQKRSSLAGETP